MAAAFAGPSGRVVDASGAPLSDVTVEWTGGHAWTRTDTAGRFAFAEPASPTLPSVQPVPAASPGPGTAWALSGTRLLLALDQGTALSAERVDAAGRTLGRTVPVVLGAGGHTVELRDLVPGASEAGAHWIRIRAAGDSRTFRLVSAGNGRSNIRMTWGSRSRAGEATASRAAAGGAGDSLRFSREGFRRRAAFLGPGVGPGVGPEEEGEIEVSLEPGLDFVSHFSGSGLVEDIASGQSIRLPPERRIQVVLVAEGYTRPDLEAGRFRKDVDAWMRDVFALEPLGAFREAFMVWTWPSPSPARLPRPGEADPGTSPFRLKVAAGKVREPESATRARIWDLVDRLPHAPWGWYPAGGLTHRQAKNVVVQILALNPATGRAGYSGLARRMADPADPRRTVNVAIGQEQQHEFMHALANLMDEYHDTASAPVGGFVLENRSRSFTNLSPTRECGKLPWRHLLPGGSANPGAEGQVGAFGAGGRFHPELKCLMNGTHHNAVLFGGDGYLRLRDRLCNLCREITLFRIYERIGILPDPAVSLAAWQAGYRAAFYRRFPFRAPDAPHGTDSRGRAISSPCSP